jgi:site-specific DNA recombinase
MVICAGGGKKGYLKYGCHAHKHNGMCGNKLMIRQDRLEEQVLDAIGQRSLNPSALGNVVKRCEEELKKRLADMERQGSLMTVESLRGDLEDRKRWQAKVIEAIETAGDINVLTERLRTLAAEIKNIQQTIAGFRPVNPDIAVGEIRGHVTRTVLGLRQSLAIGAGRNDVARAKAAIAKHIGKLVLTPATRDGRSVYRVTGNITLPDSEKCRMQVVARDGIERHYTALSLPLVGIVLNPAA